MQNFYFVANMRIARYSILKQCSLVCEKHRIEFQAEVYNTGIVLSMKTWLSKSDFSCRYFAVSPTNHYSALNQHNLSFVRIVMVDEQRDLSHPGTKTHAVDLPDGE